jgi:hypothetical protein
LILAACGPPAEGEPCAPGSPLVYDDTRPSYGVSYLPYTIWHCTGPAGCEGAPDFQWTSWRYGYYTYCGCDGTTRSSNLDFGSPPNVRWRFYGSCEEPCADVGLDPRRGRFVWSPGGHRLTPIAPQCEDCTRAVGMNDEGACVDEDDAMMPRVCCDCSTAQVGATGACAHRDFGFAMPAFCCPR